MNQSRKNHNYQSGNALVIVLLGVVLFAALMFAFTRGIQQGGQNMSSKQADIAASDILSYAQKLDRAISRIQRKSFSENDISFDNPFVSGLGYTNANCVVAGCRVFDANGGAIGWQEPAAGVSTGTWIFTAGNYVNGLGAIGNRTDSELMMILPNVTLSVCRKINELLRLTAIDAAPPQENLDSSVTVFNGIFSNTPKLIEEKGAGTALQGKMSGCFEGDTTPAAGTYHFYHVLLKRP